MGGEKSPTRHVRMPLERPGIIRLLKNNNSNNSGSNNSALTLKLTPVLRIAHFAGRFNKFQVDSTFW